MNYLSAKEAAEKWGCSDKTVTQLCRQNKVDGAKKISGKWNIPADTEKPGVLLKSHKKFNSKNIYALLTIFVPVTVILTFVISQLMGGAIFPVSIESSTVVPYSTDGMHVVTPNTTPAIIIDVSASPLPKEKATQTQNDSEGSPTPNDDSAVDAIVSTTLNIEDRAENSPTPTSSPTFENITRSNLHPYVQAGMYETETNMPQTVIDSISCEKAFSVLNFLKNPKSNEVRITENYLEVINIASVEIPVLKFLPTIEGDAFVVYIVNNGRGGATDCSISVVFTPTQPEKYDVSKLLTEKDKVSSFAVARGERVKALHFDVNKAELIQMANESVPLNISTVFELSVGDSKQITYSGQISRNGISLFWNEGSGGHSDDYSIEFAVPFSVNELRSGSRIDFNGRKHTPVVSNSLRIETTLVPDKSCIITFRIVYKVDGRILTTPEYTANVDVPYYSDWENGIVYNNVEFSRQIQEIYDAD